MRARSYLGHTGELTSGIRFRIVVWCAGWALEKIGEYLRIALYGQSIVNHTYLFSLAGQVDFCEGQSFEAEGEYRRVAGLDERHGCCLCGVNDLRGGFTS